jgi:hypothetical protein
LPALPSNADAATADAGCIVPVNVGFVANTANPLPVSSVSALARFALEGVAAHVATPVPNPVTPVAMGTVMVLLLP